MIEYTGSQGVAGCSLLPSLALPWASKGPKPRTKLNSLSSLFVLEVLTRLVPPWARDMILYIVLKSCMCDALSPKAFEASHGESGGQ